MENGTHLNNSRVVSCLFQADRSLEFFSYIIKERKAYVPTYLYSNNCKNGTGKKLYIVQNNYVISYLTWS